MPRNNVIETQWQTGYTGCKVYYLGSMGQNQQMLIELISGKETGR